MKTVQAPSRASLAGFFHPSVLIRSALFLAIGIAFFHEGGPIDPSRAGPIDRGPASSPNLVSFLGQPQLPSNPAPTTSLLPIAQTVTSIQAGMSAGVPAGTPVWSGVGPLPGSDFNLTPPSFTLASMGCAISAVSFLGESLPGISCGALADPLTPASGSFYGLGSGSAAAQPGASLGTGGIAIPASAALAR